VDLCEIGCEDGSWMELSQDLVQWFCYHSDSEMNLVTQVVRMEVG